MTRPRETSSQAQGLTAAQWDRLITWCRRHAADLDGNTISHALGEINRDEQGRRLPPRLRAPQYIAEACRAAGVRLVEPIRKEASRA